MVSQDKSSEIEAGGWRGIHRFEAVDWQFFAVLLLGGIFRFAFIEGDLPQVYDRDEPIFVDHAVSMLRNLDPNPHWFGAPAGTTIYLLCLAFLILFACGHLLGRFDSLQTFVALYQTDPTLFYLSGRIITALFAIGSIALVFLLGRRLISARAGVLAAAIVAITPSHIEMSRLVRMDVPMGFFMLAGFWYCLNILEYRAFKDYLLAGVFTGLGVVSKYPAIVFALVVILAHALVEKHRKFHRLVSAGISSIAAAFLASPFLFLDFKQTLSDVAFEARPTELGGTGAGLLNNLGWYLFRSTPRAISYAGLVLVFAYFIFCWRSLNKKILLLTALPVFFMIFISSLSLRWDRWILPMIPFFALLVALAESRLNSHLNSWMSDRFTNKSRLLVTSFCLSVIYLPLLVTSVKQMREMARPHTWTIGRQWILQNLPQGSRVFIEVTAPHLPSGSFQFFQVADNGTIVEEKRENRDPGSDFRPSGEFGSLKNIEELRSKKIEYFVVGDRYKRYLIEREKYPQIVATYQAIIAEGELLWEIDRVPGKSRGTNLQVYRVRGQ